MIKRLVPLLGIAVVVSLLFWLWMRQQVPETELNKVEDIRADLSLGGIELSQGREGRTLWKLKAENGTYRKDSQVVLLRRPKVTYFREDNPEPILISGPRGRVDQARDTAVIFPGVRMTKGEAVVTAENATYLGKERKIIFRGGVNVSRNASELNATRMEYFLDREFLRAFGGVRAVLN
jgi:LPS export ABC transporter protein LptC